MQLFADYVQPVTQWLYNHPHWAIFITFIVSFSESLAVIGSIVPGSVTMTALGILAGSGVMRIDLTLVAATLGAIAGDSASYFLGYIYKDRLVNLWPFNRHPKVLEYGKQYFINHGGKSVLIGRFAGPLRAIIPVIAGMMGMSQKRFLIANILSAIGWSILYIMPGVLIGAASADLSAETATRLFAFVLFGILFFWLAGIALRWIIIRLNVWLERNLHSFWEFSGNHPILQHIILYVTPEDEKNHYPTVSLVLAVTLSFIFLIILTLSLLTSQWFIQVNDSLHYFFTSLRTAYFDNFFSIILFSYSPLTLSLIAVSLSIMSLVLKKYRLLLYWIMMIISTIVLCGVLNNLVKIPYPSGNFLLRTGSSFPSTPLALMIAMLSFSSALITRNILDWPALLYRYFALGLSFLACLSAIYLGDRWFFDVLASILIGLFSSLLHYIIFRRQPRVRIIPACWIGGIVLIWLCATLIQSYFLLNKSMRAHQLVFIKKTISVEQWWNQNPTALPHYRKNRLGIPVDVFNIQYVGSLSTLENFLRSAGWKRVNKSFWQVLLEQMKDRPHSMRLPILTQLYLNKKPRLIMLRQYKTQFFVVRFWDSNYIIEKQNVPVFFATLHPHGAKQPENAERKIAIHKNFQLLMKDTLKGLQEGVEWKRLPVQFDKKMQFKTLVPPYVYLLKEKNQWKQ